jgi:hypothetical protein
VSDRPITLDFLAEQQARILDQLRTMQDDATVATAILMRLDGTVSGLVQEVRAMHSQHARLSNRVRALEDKAQ